VIAPTGAATQIAAWVGIGLLTEFSALNPGATQQLAMLLLGHALAPLLDY